MTSTARQLRQPLAIEAIERVLYFPNIPRILFNNVSATRGILLILPSRPSSLKTLLNLRLLSYIKGII